MLFAMSGCENTNAPARLLLEFGEPPAHTRRQRTMQPVRSHVHNGVSTKTITKGKEKNTKTKSNKQQAKTKTKTKT